MSESTRRGSGSTRRGSIRFGRGGSGRGRSWGILRQAVHTDENGGVSGVSGRGAARRPTLLNAMKRTSFRLSQRRMMRGESNLPEEGGDLHKHFRTCASLTRIREEFRNAIGEDAGQDLGCGLNACGRPEEESGRLLLHSIGFNSNLVSVGSGGTAVALSRVNQFVLQELLQVYPTAIVEEDNNGHIPFIEPIVQWIEARKAVRKWKFDTDRTRQTVELLATNWRGNARSAAVGRGDHPDSDSEDSFSDRRKKLEKLKSSLSLGSWITGKNEEKRTKLKLIVESADDAVFCLDEKGVFVLTNDAAAKQFGYSKKELRGSNISIICDPKDPHRHGNYLEHYLKTGGKEAMGKKRELLARRKDGSTFYIELDLTKVNLLGGKFIFCCFVKDLTQWKSHRKCLGVAQSNISDSQENGEKEVIGRNMLARGIPPLVEWCLTILSEFVDNYSVKKSGRLGREDDDDSSLEFSMTDIKASFAAKGTNEITFATMRHALVVEKVASIPHFLEELLLVEDPEARSRVFDMSIVRKILFNTDSLGDGRWLIEMLDKSIRVQKQKNLDTNLTCADIDTAEGRAFQLKLRLAHDECRFLAEGVVFYLEQVSELNIQDDLYVFHHLQMHQEVTHNNVGGVAEMISTGDVHHFNKYRDELFEAVGVLKGLIRRICVLEDDLLKRAAATPVIRRMLDKIMFSPFATLAALFDGINHLLLMISFRLGPAPALFQLSKHDDTFQPQQYLIASAMLVSSVAYFGTKVIHTGLAKYAVSENLFWSDAFTFWSFLETIPLLMVLFCAIAVDIVLRQRAHTEVEDDNDIPFFLRTMVAITTPFLWMRIMAFVKVRNKQLATFILCSVEIMKDIKWFLLVLFAAMASFAQMWESLTFEVNQSQSQYYMEGYLKAYTMMLGDLDSDALKTHPLIAILFVIYTFGVTVVLLNILIAIVSDSYQNSFSTSKMMLSKARVMFVSELLSIKTFHHMWMEGKTCTTRRHVNYVFGLYAMLHLWMVTRTINEKLGKYSLCDINAHFSSPGMTTETINEKLDQDPFCKTSAISPGRVNLEAFLAFFILSSMLFAMKKTIVYVLNEFDDTVDLTFEKKSPSRLQRAVNWFVKTAFSTLSKSFDTLFDLEDTQKQLRNSTISKEHRTDNAVQRSIEQTRKKLKAELKVMFEQLQLSLREHQDENQEIISKVEEQISSLARSQQLMIQLMSTTSKKDKEEVSYGEDESEGSHSSLSLSRFDQV